MLIEPISSGFTVAVTSRHCITPPSNRANVTTPPKPTVLELILGFMNVGLTSVGGAVGPIRYVLVRQRGWLTEGELAETVGIAQVLPGANAVNCAVMIGDRFAGTLGSLAALAGLIIPSLVLAVILLAVASHLAATNPRFAAAEISVTAAIAGIFMANGLRLGRFLWRDTGDVRAARRAARLAISALGVLLVAGLHLFIPAAVAILASVSVLVERRLEAKTAAPE